MPKIRSIVSVLAVGSALALPAQAQQIIPRAPRTAKPVFALEGNLLYSRLGGRDYHGTEDGVGFDAQATLGVDAFALGGGYLRTTHAAPSGSDITMQGFFIEPRIALPFYYENFTPYILGRVTRVNERREVSGGTREAWGTALGGGGGLLVRLVPGLQLNMALTYNAMRLGDAKLAGQRLTGTSTRGNSVGFRAGMSLGYGEWGVKP
jgi:hypothetical protein